MLLGDPRFPDTRAIPIQRFAARASHREQVLQLPGIGAQNLCDPDIATPAAGAFENGMFEFAGGHRIIIAFVGRLR